MTKTDLLFALCRMVTAIPFGYDPKIYSIPGLSRYLNETKYRVRKCMKELEADGLVKKSYEGGVDGEGIPYCYHGWRITERAERTDMYERCRKEAIKELEQVLSS